MLPSSALIHSAALEVVTGTTDPFGKPIIDEFPLTKVRFDAPTKGQLYLDIQRENTYKALMFYDSFLSGEQPPEEGQRIQFDNATFYVDHVEKYYKYDGDTPHHLEVYLT